MQIAFPPPAFSHILSLTFVTAAFAVAAGLRRETLLLLLICDERPFHLSALHLFVEHLVAVLLKRTIPT